MLPFGTVLFVFNGIHQLGYIHITVESHLNEPGSKGILVDEFRFFRDRFIDVGNGAGDRSIDVGSCFDGFNSADAVTRFNIFGYFTNSLIVSAATIVLMELFALNLLIPSIQYQS